MLHAPREKRKQTPDNSKESTWTVTILNSISTKICMSLVMDLGIETRSFFRYLDSIKDTKRS